MQSRKLAAKLKKLHQSSSSSSLIILKPYRSPQKDREDSPSKDSKQPDKQQTKIMVQFEQTTNFPSIFTSRQRGDYSGYKHNSANKSNSSKGQVDCRQTVRHQLPKKKDITQQSIAKLRKRYSLEPINFRLRSYEQGLLFRGTAKSQGKHEETTLASEKRCHNELKSMVRGWNSGHSQSERTFVTGDVEQDSSVEKTRTSCNQSHFQRYNLKESQKSPPKQELSSPITFQKPCRMQIKKRVEQKFIRSRILRKEMLKSKQCSGLTRHEERQNDLCGWSNQSFYPKAKARFFLDYGERLKLMAN